MDVESYKSQHEKDQKELEKLRKHLGELDDQNSIEILKLREQVEILEGLLDEKKTELSKISFEKKQNTVMLEETHQMLAAVHEENEALKKIIKNQEETGRAQQIEIDNLKFALQSVKESFSVEKTN